MTVAPIANFSSEPIPWPFLNLDEAFPDHMTHDHIREAVKNYLADFFR